MIFSISGSITSHIMMSRYHCWQDMHVYSRVNIDIDLDSISNIWRCEVSRFKSCLCPLFLHIHFFLLRGNNLSFRLRQIKTLLVRLYFQQNILKVVQYLDDRGYRKLTPVTRCFDGTLSKFFSKWGEYDMYKMSFTWKCVILGMRWTLSDICWHFEWTNYKRVIKLQSY